MKKNYFHIQAINCITIIILKGDFHDFLDFLFNYVNPLSFANPASHLFMFKKIALAKSADVTQYYYRKIS